MKPLLEKKKQLLETQNDIESFYVTAILIAISLAVLIVSISISVLINELPSFSVLTDFYNEIVVPDGEHDTLVIPCTNLSLGDETKTFSHDTYLFKPCPTTDNECSLFNCRTDGNCEQTLATGASCYQNAQCGNNSRCDLSLCECVDDHPSCSIDGDCGTYNSNPCANNVCISGQCVTELIAGADCGSSTNCADQQSCSSDCMCVQDTIYPSSASYIPVIFSLNPRLFPFLTTTIEAYGQYSILGDWVLNNIYFTAIGNMTTELFPQNNMDFGFTTPTLVDTAEFGSGIVTINPINSSNVTGELPSSGITYTFSSTVGEASATPMNYNYIGPVNEILYEISLFLIYKKQ